jgi:ATP-dependent RNA helicase SUPV3L1/SUV3
MSPARASGRLTAVLGPTNTGKTYLAIERMLGHESGMIGFPLRLLARENYDRIVKIKGAHQVALVTGEEKITPPGARYFVCTVESMPLDRAVSFLAVDEVQMAADPERGHFFTDRLLNARGINETMLLGADTIRPVLNRLLPDIDVVARPRFSKLSYVGPKKATRLPQRSAVVGFSANEVYAIAELIRRQRGGTAIVMGALSPRTRNAQVEMFQSGEVDYLVATDAIGMGLNMDVNHVWFASLRKFDGRQLRPLRDVELAQIAGRAGRHMNDGTFGTTIDVGGLDEETVEAIENHRFDPLRDLQWRNTALDFRSVPQLIASLNAAPPHAVLQRVREQDDQLALQTLAQHSEFLPRLHAPGRVKLLWEICQVPDFRKTMTEEHTALLGQLFQHLTQGGERLPEDWIDSHVKRLERFDGDIDTLMTRIAHVRTWTYISHRADWIQRATHWQERARAIEDRLSDVLHQRLTQRFVDRRAALLVRRLRDEGEMTTSVAEAGEVIVEGEHLGRIEGFRFVPDTTEGQTDQKAVLSAALRALRENLPTRLQAFAAAPDGELVFDSQLRVCWGGGPVARLLPSGDVLAPKVEALPSDLLDGPAREDVRKRATAWVETRIRLGLSELMDARAASDQLPPGARGIVFQLCEHLGVLPRRPIEQQLAELSEDDRKALAKLGVRVGVYSLYFPSMLKPVPIRLRAGLWMVASSRDTIPPLPIEGRTSMDLPQGAEREFYAAIGYLPLGNHAIRADMVERLAAMARQAVRESRENARRAQQEKQDAQPDRRDRKDGRREARAEPPAPPVPAPASDAEISEWAIAAAAFGESEPAIEVTAEAPVPQARAEETAPEATVEEAAPEATAEEPASATDDHPAYATEENAPAGPPEAKAEAEASAPHASAEEARAERLWPMPCRHRNCPGRGQARRPSAVAARLVPRHAAMMSLVGCSEPEMADVIRGLGYRVHPPSEEHGPLHAFSVKPRFVREREEQRERQRLQERERREQRRRERPGAAERAPVFADTPRREGPGRDGPNREPRRDGAPPERRDGPPRDGAPRGEGGRQDRPRDERPRGPRPPRRDTGGPALRLYATTEKKGDPATDSPFAKLLELKLGGKK